MNAANSVSSGESNSLSDELDCNNNKKNWYTLDNRMSEVRLDCGHIRSNPVCNNTSKMSSFEEKKMAKSPNLGSSGNTTVFALAAIGIAAALAASVWVPISGLTDELRKLMAHIDKHGQGFVGSGELPKDCWDIQQNGHSKSGVYKVFPGGAKRGIDVFCDMDTDEGGWLVFNRRMDGSEDFKRNWAAYQIGFGDINAEFWLGNEFLHTITTQGLYELRIDMESFDQEEKYAKYRLFRIDGNTDKFRLTVAGYSGDAGDSFSSHNGYKFSTNDADNDEESGSCSLTFGKSGWWYSNCLTACLTGNYYKGEHSTKADGINWFHFRGYTYSLKFAEMKIRPL